MSGAIALFEQPGPKARRRHFVLTAFSLLAGAAFLAWVILRLQSKDQLLAEKWSPFLTVEIWREYLLPGLIGTLSAAALAIVIALTAGILLGIGRVSDNPLIRVPCSIWVELFRSVPVLMLMLLAYGALIWSQAIPAEKLSFVAVVIGLVLYNSAVVAELVRAGVSSLPRGQSEAGRAIGLPEGQLMWSILLPQALTAMLPSLISQLVVVLKDTALGYIIGYEELLRKAEQIGTYKSNVLPALLVVAALFIGVNWSLTIFAGRLEKRLNGRNNPSGPATKKVKGKTPLAQPVP
jgi:glutamate transport system permease protein